MMRSYTSAGLRVMLRDLPVLRRTHGDGAVKRVTDLIRDAKVAERRISERYGRQLRDLDVLDIGTGQFLTQLIYFAQCNRAIGIDADVYAEGLNPIPYVRMAVVNGPARTIKTIGRKVLGIDRRYRDEVRKQLN